MAKYYPIPHNSDEWFQCRRGIPTSSCFDKIVTPTGKFSKQSEDYAYILLGELVTGENLDTFPPTYDMERGHILEYEASKLYEFETGFTIDRGGFITDDLARWGCSPDRRVLDKSGNVIGALEIKCPKINTQLKNLRRKDIDPKYNPQVQGQMFVGEFQFVDWFSYHPDTGPALVRTERNDEYIEILSRGLHEFDEMMKRFAKELVESGGLSQMPVKVMPEIRDGVQDLIDGNIETTLTAG